MTKKQRVEIHAGEQGVPEGFMLKRIPDPQGDFGMVWYVVDERPLRPRLAFGPYLRKQQALQEARWQATR